MRTIKILVLSMFFLLSYNNLALAEKIDASASASQTTIDMPAGAEISIKDDYSAGLFAQMLGPAWTQIAGENNVFGGAGEYSGLILAILKVFNLAGLSVVTVIMLYQWGIFAVATAHSGQKIGGNVYSSLWVPVRQVAGFSMCIPIWHGLSLLQYIILCAIGFGINTANLIYETGTTYIISHVSAGSSDTSATQSQIIDSEALSVVQPLFQGVLAQEATFNFNRDAERQSLFSSVKTFDKPTPISRYRTIQVQGNYIIEFRPLEGELILWIRPVGKTDLGTLGGVKIPVPTSTLKNGEIVNGVTDDEKAAYAARFAIAQLRMNEMAKLADSLRPWARYHIAGEQEREDGRAPKPEKNGLAIAEEYRLAVSEGAATQIQAMVASRKKINDKLSQSIGVTSIGKTAEGGWVGAGVIPTVLSLASVEADALYYGGGVKPVVVDPTAGIVSKDSGLWGTLVSWWGGAMQLPEAYVLKMQYGPMFATQVLMGGRAWSGHDGDGDGPGYMNQAITYMFTDGDLNNTGILNSTITDFKNKNPIVALKDFGERALRAGGIALGVSAVAGMATAIPGIGGVIAGMVNNALFLALMGGLLLVGALCVFVVPLVPVLMWFRGVLGWIIHALMSLLGAPLLCIATIFPEGAGLAGQHARKGYVQIFDIAIRPAIMTACLFFAYALTKLSVLILAFLFTKIANGMSSYASTGFVWQLGMSIMFVSLIYGTIHTIFKQLVLEAPRAIMVILPFLVALQSRAYAACLRFIAGVIPPMPMLGRSLL